MISDQRSRAYINRFCHEKITRQDTWKPRYALDNKDGRQLQTVDIRTLPHSRSYDCRNNKSVPEESFEMIEKVVVECSKVPG